MMMNKYKSRAMLNREFAFTDEGRIEFGTVILTFEIQNEKVQKKDEGQAETIREYVRKHNNQLKNDINQ